MSTVSSQGLQLADYDYSWTLSRSRWAWEFLRRNPEFREEAAKRDPEEISRRVACNNIEVLRPKVDQADAERWGLAFFPNVDENGIDADVFWNAALYPRSMNVQVTPRHPGEVDDIFERSVRACRITHLTDTSGREYLLLRGNNHVVQVGCTGLSLLSVEPVKMKIVIEAVTSLDESLTIIERAKPLYRTDQQNAPPEWTRTSLAFRNAIISLDAHAQRLSYLETASIIYGSKRASEAWSGPSRAMKDEMKRALARGRDLRDGGYRALLSPPT